MDGVEGAPEVGDFIFKDSAREGEHTVDGLGELEDGGVVDSFGIGCKRE